MKRIHLISGPRNISTALMYSFGNREDCAIVDEPFYAYYLQKHPEVDHPGREEVLQSQSANFNEILRDIISKDRDKEIFFIKNMAHHLHDSDWSFMKDLDNLFLVRDPKQLISSFSRVIYNPTMLDIGLKLELDILRFCIDNEVKFNVVDSNDILKNPEDALKSICLALGIEFSSRMLKWEPGSREEDGVWAPYWYGSVHQSTCFEKQSSNSYEVPDHLLDLLREAEDYYKEITRYKIKLSD